MLWRRWGEDGGEVREGEGEGERGGSGRRWGVVGMGKWLDVSCGGLVRVGGVVEYVW